MPLEPGPGLRDYAVMPSVAALVTPDALVLLAQPANLRLGRRIVSEGEVELLTVHEDRVVGRVGDEQRRTTTLTIAKGDLHWRCTCTSDTELFCKHCVALALAVRAAE